MKQALRNHLILYMYVYNKAQSAQSAKLLLVSVAEQAFLCLNWWKLPKRQYFVMITNECLFSSGIIGGKFLERCRIKKPDQMNYSTRMSEYYLAQDLFVGAQVDFNRHKFVLIDADEYAFRYMEDHAYDVSTV